MEVVRTEATSPYEYLSLEFDKAYADHQSTIARDLKINFRRAITDSSLSKEEATMVTLAVARSLDFSTLIELARTTLVQEGIEAAQIQEVEESAAIMGMLNIYYRFRHFVDGQQDGDGYGPAKLRMQSLGNPLLGKVRFEMLALAVSIVNGCEKCVTSHEKALKSLGVEIEKLHDLARLAATLKGLQALNT